MTAAHPTRFKRCPLCKGSGKIPTDQAIGAAMRTLREQAALSLQQLAPRVGCGIAYLSHLETGRRRWNCNLQERYLKGLKLKL